MYPQVATVIDVGSNVFYGGNVYAQIKHAFLSQCTCPIVSVINYVDSYSIE